MAGGIFIPIFKKGKVNGMKFTETLENMKINILGTEWDIEHRNADADPLLDERDGYTDPSVNLIVIVNKRKDDDVLNFKEIQKRCLRHEIIHAFLFESGLGVNFEHSQYGHEETMVDWIAIQFPKILEVFKEADCL